MKFLAAAALATGASASITFRDVSDIQTVLRNVGTAISSLTDSVQGYSGGSVADQVEAGEALDSTLVAGQTQIGTDSLGLTDAVLLSSPVGSLASLATPLVSALSSARGQVEEAGSCSQVRSIVNAVFSDGNDLVGSVIALVQSDAQGIASNLASPLQAALSSASADYAACSDSGNGGGSGSSSGGSSGSSTGSGSGSGSGSATETGSASSTGAESSATGSAGSSAGATTTPAVTPTLPGGGSGGAPTTTPGTGVVPTAAAAAFAPAGALALAAAVLAL